MHKYMELITERTINIFVAAEEISKKKAASGKKYNEILNKHDEYLLKQCNDNLNTNLKDGL